MRSDTDPTVMTQDERGQEVAFIFAAGLLRLRSRNALLGDPHRHSDTEILSESGQDCLAVSPETVLSVHTG